MNRVMLLSNEYCTCAITKTSRRNRRLASLSIKCFSNKFEGNPRRGFPSCTACNSPFLRFLSTKSVSLSAESDERCCLSTPKPF